MRIWAGIVVALGVAGGALAEPCGPGATLDYPLQTVLNIEAQGYVVTAIMTVDSDAFATAEEVMSALSSHWPAYLQALEAREAELPAALADLPYLIALGEVLAPPVDPFHVLAYGVQSAALPRMIEVAERRGLAEEAELLRLPMLAFPDWEEGPDARFRQSNSDDPDHRQWATDLAVNALSRAAPRVLAATEALIASDPAIAAEYEARRQATDAETRIQYLTHRLIVECLADWWTPDEADAAFAAMGQAQQDILLLHFFLAESYNGSAHQYFYNSSGTMAPQLVALLDRIGLPDHAAGIRQGMAVFPSPYPRDTDARREVMAGFTAADDDALYALTIWADDGEILTAMARIAEAAGLMPR
ncbi:MAG: DMP19 family protein [Tabrizicola sp.]|nr:DMP19 family protein [Tabrizicola sp.]